MEKKVPKFDEFINERFAPKFKKTMIGGHLPDDLDFVKDYLQEVLNIMSKHETGNSFAGLRQEQGKEATKPVLDKFNKKYGVKWQDIKKAFNL